MKVRRGQRAEEMEYMRLCYVLNVVFFAHARIIIIIIHGNHGVNILWTLQFAQFTDHSSSWRRNNNTTEADRHKFMSTKDPSRRARAFHFRTSSQITVSGTSLDRWLLCVLLVLNSNWRCTGRIIDQNCNAKVRVNDLSSRLVITHKRCTSMAK